MNWEDIKKDVSKIHPKRKTSIYEYNTGYRTSFGWVNEAYAHYPYREFCRYCVEIQVRLGKRDTKKEKRNRFQMYFKLAKIGDTKLNFEYIESYFATHLTEVCTALCLHMRTTKKGFKVQIYVDDVESTAHKLNEMKTNKNRPFDFYYTIEEDENWDIVGMMLY